MESLLGNTRCPDVSFFRNGRIDITSRVARSLGIRDGDVIDIARCDRELYLYVKWRREDVVGKHTAQCHATKQYKKCTNLRAFSVKLCKTILEIVGADDIAKLAAGEAIAIQDMGTAVPLITRINLHTNE